jgi:hypothetical protein
MMNDQSELTMYTTTSISSNNNNDSDSRLIIKSQSLESASESASDKAFEKPKFMLMKNETSKLQNYSSSRISSSKNNNNNNKNNDNDDIDNVVNDINTACAVSNVVDRLCEDSVTSDVSALTDVSSIKNGGNGSSQSLSEFTHSLIKKNNNSSSKNNNNMNSDFKSVVCAPEPPMIDNNDHRVSPKLTDIASETTPTTISNDHDETISLRNNNNKKKRSVSFCEVHVRNYDRVLTVNPSVTSGPAVGLGWNYDVDEDQHFSIQNFEDSRELVRRGSMKELALPRSYREELVRSLGYTQREIASSTRQIIRLKNQRKQTIQNLHASSMEEFIENATRKVKRVFSFPGTGTGGGSASNSVHAYNNNNNNNNNNKENKRSNKKTKQQNSSFNFKNHRDSFSGSFLLAQQQQTRKTSSLDESHRLPVVAAA